MFEYLTEDKKKIYTALILVPIVIIIAWLAYIKISGTMGTGQGNFFSPIDNSGLIVVLVIFLFVYVFFVGMIFFDNIKDYIVSHLRR